MGIYGWVCGQGSWICRNVGWSWSKNHNDWYPYSIAVVHLRHCEGRLQATSTTSTTNARITKKETRSSTTINFRCRVWLYKSHNTERCWTMQCALLYLDTFSYF